MKDSIVKVTTGAVSNKIHGALGCLLTKEFHFQITNRCMQSHAHCCLKKTCQQKNSKKKQMTGTEALNFSFLDQPIEEPPFKKQRLDPDAKRVFTPHDDLLLKQAVERYMRPEEIVEDVKFSCKFTTVRNQY